MLTRHLEAQAAAPRAPLGFGALAHLAPDNLYFARHGGYLYTCPQIATQLCTPHSAAVFISACRAPFVVRLGDCIHALPHTQNAAVIGCRPRSLTAIDVKLVIAHVSPLHPAYRALQFLAHPGLLGLERDLFAPLDNALTRAFDGTLTPQEAGLLYDGILSVVTQHLPRPRMPDPRAQRWIAILRDEPQRSLRSLAIESRLSYQHMSKIFSESLGISLRQFQLWQKLDRVRRVYTEHDNLTDIAHAAGFSDLAHMTRIFQRNFGAPPSYFFRNSGVRMIGAIDSPSPLRP